MSKFFGNSILGNVRILMDTAGEGKGAGGGTPTPPADLSKDLEAERAKNADLMKRLEALEKSKLGDPVKPEENDLAEKARKDREAKEKQTSETAKLEKAIRFTTGISDFVKTNASLLPKSLDGILAQAEKEKYDSAIEKAQAVQVALVSEFFAVQSNLDLLTESQKNALAEFSALTKNVKQERVQQLYDMIFEPAFKSLKDIAKAKQLRDGEADPNDKKAAYAKRMAEISKAKFIKKGAS